MNTVTQLREAFDASEDAVAISFADVHPNYRYCHTWGQWFVWDETVWKPDQTVEVFDTVRVWCRNSSRVCAESQNDKRRFGGPSFVAGVERFLKSDRHYATTADRFDQDDWILNTPEGTVSLRDGALRAHEKDDYCTKVTRASPAGDCPLWKQVLREVTDNDQELIDYLQRVLGYCLTGSTREHALFFFYGTGANGKGTVLNTFSELLSDYAITAPIETFCESRNERHPTELAMLDGPRVVLAQETEQGRKWAETRIKALTGGDAITARRMRQDFYPFQPKFKLLIAGNNKPALTTVDEAMRRRFHIIPFTVTIPPEKRDKSLHEKLRREWPGILKWMIQGCVEYCQRDGLDPPDRVIEATNQYLESQDLLAEWLQDECEIGAEYWEKPKLLFNSWKDWAYAANEPVGQQKDFKARMEAAGHIQLRDRARGRFWDGIRVKPRESSEPDW